MCRLTTLTKEELLDVESQAREEYQAAMRLKDNVAMREAANDMRIAGLELAYLNKAESILMEC